MERVDLVLTGIEDPSPEAREQFIEGMARRFSLDTSKVERVLANLPFTLSRSCSPEEAERISEALSSLGGRCRMEGSGDKPTAQPSPDLEEPAASSAIPLAASPGARGSESASPPAENDGVSCLECGTTQSRERTVCECCSFPLPRRNGGDSEQPVASRPSRSASSARPGGPTEVRGTSTKDQGHGNLKQTYPVLLAAFLIILANCIGATLSQGALMGEQGFLFGAIGTLVGLLVGIYLLRGSRVARVLVFVFAALGVLGSLGMAKMLEAAGLKLDALGTPMILAGMLPALGLVVLLIGRGGRVKAWAVAVPCLVVIAFNSFILGTDPQLKVLMHSMQAVQQIQAGDIQDATETLEEGVTIARISGDDQALRMAQGELCNLHMATQNCPGALDACGEVARLEPSNATVLYVLAYCYAEAGRITRAEDHLFKARDLSPSHAMRHNVQARVDRALGRR